MALMILIVLGASLGWLGSIILRFERPSAVRRMVLVGAIASLVSGLIANGGTALGSLSWLALGAGVSVGIGAVVAYFAFATREA